MLEFELRRFSMLLRKECWENRNLIIGAPAIVTLVFFVFNFLVTSQLGEAQIVPALDFLNTWFSGQSPLHTAPILSVLSIPLVAVFFFSSVIYLLNALYHDRKDMSILFWQSMPVSNLQNVLSKIATVMFVSPAFLVACMAALYFVSIFGLATLGYRYDTEFGGMGNLFLAAGIDLAVLYLFLATSVLWLLPLVGWLLLFSAFARRAPMLWAIGVYSLLGFLEEFIFGSQFLANWAQTRIDPDNFLIIEFTGVAERLFSYNMFMGIVVGSVLITGAVYMRRFID